MWYLLFSFWLTSLCIYNMNDSCWCMAETTTTLWSNYPPIKKKKKKTRAVGICTEQSRRKWMVAVHPPSKSQMLIHFFPTLDISGVGCEQAGAKQEEAEERRFWDKQGRRSWTLASVIWSGAGKGAKGHRSHKTWSYTGGILLFCPKYLLVIYYVQALPTVLGIERWQNPRQKNRISSRHKSFSFPVEGKNKPESRGRMTGREEHFGWGGAWAEKWEELGREIRNRLRGGPSRQREGWVQGLWSRIKFGKSEEAARECGPTGEEEWGW